jgi:hypothetical protein
MTTPTLMVSYEAPPRLSAESILVAKTLKALADVSPAQPVIDLVCASPGDEVPSDEALDDIMPQTLRVHRIEPTAKGRKTLLQRIIGGKGGWQNMAETKSAALFPAEHKKPALIYSRSHPPASHLVGLELAAGPMKGVPWIAHFSDPWSQHPYYRSPVTRAALGRYESKVFAAATRLVFVSETLRDAMLAKYPPEIVAKARVIPHLFDESLYAKAALPPQFVREPNAKTVAHVGDLYNLRSPEPLFKGLGALVKSSAQPPALKLWQVGKFDAEFQGLDEREGVRNFIQYFTPVPYLQSLAVMAAADVLLTVEAPLKKSIFFPSKLIDYLGARKPMLAITPKSGLTARLMDEWKQPWFDVEDSAGIAAGFKRIADGQLWPPPDAGVLQKYASATVGKQLAGLFAEVTANDVPTDQGSPQ